ncbi:MAG: S8 family serine peptidase [Candidatus Thorarchaeota archaeon]
MESTVRISTVVLSLFLFIHGLFLAHGISPLFMSFDTQWHLKMVGVEAAWNYTQGSPAIVVAIIDSGVDLDHPDLFNQTWTNPGEIAGNGLDDDDNGYVDDVNGWDFRDDDNDPSPGHPHGTKVAGILAADDDSDISVGIAPEIRIMPIRFLDDNNKFWDTDWNMFIDAVNYATDNGADVIHLSIQVGTFSTPPQAFHEAILRAYNIGIPIVSVTGNNENQVTYPGNYSEVIAVSAVTSSQEIASFSAKGDQNEICAPGVDIPTIKPNSNLTENDSGTSFAAPLVSGTIALMLSLNKTLTISIIREILHATSTDLGSLGRDPDYGYGLLNASAALDTVMQDHNGTIPSFTVPNQPLESTKSTSGVDLSILEIFPLILATLVFFGSKKKKS